MPVHTELRNGKVVVVDDAGRVYGRFGNDPKGKTEARAQVAAVNNALHKRDTGKGFLPEKGKK